jgi:tRNA dimethylallyltransferase
VTAPLLCLMGPTAAGKTDVAIRLAEALDGELISVDSVLVYRGLDIGSAKPDYPHHLIDVCDPAEVYSAARFVADARAAIEAVERRGRRPILVGGTMLYFRALIEGLSPLPESDPALRAQIEREAEVRGWPALHAELAAVDPASAARIHPRHSQRLCRAIEVCRLTGSPLSALQAAPASPFPGKVRSIALAPAERAWLHRRIDRRFDALMARGFLDEVRALRDRGDLHPGLPALRAVGYRQLWDYLDGQGTLAEAVERGKAATRQLAKRQFTWLRKWPELQWIRCAESGAVLQHDLGNLPGDAPQSENPADLLLNYLA